MCALPGAASGCYALESSQVLVTMGIDPKIVRGATCFRLSRFATAAEINQTVEVLVEVIERLSAMVA